MNILDHGNNESDDADDDYINNEVDVNNDDVSLR